MIKVRHVTTSKASLLERLARKVDPTDTMIKSAGLQLPKHSRVARLMIPAAHIPHMKDKLNEPGGSSVARPTDAAVEMLDKTVLRFHSDGSLRHALGRIKGKAARKAAKRAKHRG